MELVLTYKIQKLHVPMGIGRLSHRAIVEKLVLTKVTEIRLIHSPSSQSPLLEFKHGGCWKGVEVNDIRSAHVKPE